MTPAALALTHAAAFTRPRPWNADEFRALLAEPGVILAGDAHAFVLGRVTLDEAEILTLATHPAHRRQGLARGALVAFLDACQDAGARRCFLEVAEDNHPALRLYEGAGFRPVGQRPDYYGARDGAPVGAVVMARDLG